MTTATKKITLATVKSFLRKNGDNVFINAKSSFDGMVDCVMPIKDAAFEPVVLGNVHPHTLGITNGAWFVGESRDYLATYEDSDYVGYEVYNSCGCFVLAVKK